MLSALRPASELIRPARLTAGPQSADVVCTDAVALFRGSLVLLSGEAALSVATAIFAQFQHGGQVPLPWIINDNRVPNPPDLVSAGVDLSRTIWFSVPGHAVAATTTDALLRSGEFPLICVDVAGLAAISPGNIARFMHRARGNGTTVLFLSESSVAAPSPAIAFQLEVTAPDSHRLEVHVRRTRVPLNDGVCNVGTAVPLS
ncbi:MAG: hypothetical protein PF508_18370 [Spirochaeta sp.]|jgi:hypothetical protein|nr:hypothetical protein [Spirochaeta sp.]